MYVQRRIEESLFQWLDEREIIALIGPRQCGKTTLLQQIRHSVVESGKYDKDHTVYLTLDEEIERTKFEKDPVGHIRGHLTDSAPYLFLLDEVQYVENAGTHLKVIFDRFHERIKFIITGSSGLDLRNIGGSLVGRVIFFDMHPFSFEEFLQAKDRNMYKYYKDHRFEIDGPRPKEWKDLVYLDRLNSLLREYITYGGFPRVVLMDDVGKKEILLRQMITMYIEKDILKLYGQSFRNDALKVIQYLAFHSGGMLNQEDISSGLGIEIRKVRETMDILEDIHIIKTVRPFYKSMSTELRKRPKIYFVDNGIRNALAEDFTFSREKGFLLEGFILSQLLHRDPEIKYWRTTAKAEVDFVLKGTVPIEVKSTPKITRAFRSFVSTYKPPMGLVVNYDSTGVHKVNGTKVYYVPACLL